MVFLQAKAAGPLAAEEIRPVCEFAPPFAGSQVDLNGRDHPYQIKRPADFRGMASPGLARWRDPARMQSMAKSLTADDILPLVASLTPQERVRLLRLIALPQGGAESVYRSVPPSRDEFSADEEPLAWDADGWEDVG